MKKPFTALFCMTLLLVPCAKVFTDENQQKSQGTSSYKAFSEPFIQAAKKASPSVVSIRTEIKPQHDSRRPMNDEEEITSPEEFWERFFGFSPFPNMPKGERRPEQAFGSGFIVSNDGYILTNNHMVENGTKILVQFPDGHELEAKLIGGDGATDIALLKVDAKNLPALTLIDSSKVETGEWVLAIGNPLGLRASVTSGIISAKGRSDLDLSLVEEFLQTDASINQGNSGGPLVNLNGDVVGMNTLILTSSGGSMGIGFAISSNLLQDVMKELIAHGKLIRGFLGVALQQINTDLAPALGLEKPQGALITDVLKKSPAEAAGLKSGDIIIKVNNIEIESRGNLKKAIAFLHPGQKVELTILRSHKSMTIPVTIGEVPLEENGLVELNNNFGMSLEPITSEIAKRYDLLSTSGLLIVQIDPNGQAYGVGLRPGHVILAVNGQEVKSVDEFRETCSKVEKGKKILLQVRIGKHIRYVSLTAE